MADTKLTALTETTSPATTDDVYIVTTPGGTPASKRCTIANLKTAMGVVTPAMVRITQVVVGVGGAANFDLTSIAGTYETLVLHWMGRSDAAGAKQKYVGLLINNDSGNNYDVAAVVADDNSVQQDSGTAQAFAWIGYIPAATAPAGSCGAGVLELPNYARTVFHKIGHYRAMHYGEAVSPSDLMRSYAAGIRWRNTAAITRLTLTPETGNWLEGSVATLYGVT